MLDLKQNYLSINANIEKQNYSKIALEILYKGLDDKSLSEDVLLQSPSTLAAVQKIIRSVSKKMIYK